jgi:6-phosphogluconate dehydrogenase
MLDEFFAKQLNAHQMNWRKTVAETALMGISTSAITSSLNYYDAMRTAVLPANLLQGQRDFFGAHTFERLDQERGKKFHVEWSQPDREMIDLSHTK